MKIIFMLKWFKALLELQSGELYAPFLCRILKKKCWNVLWRQCWPYQMIDAISTRALQKPHIFVNVKGHEDVVCFRNVVEYIINEKLLSFKYSIEDKAEWVVQADAKIMRDEILEKHYNCKFYPTN